MAKKITKHDIIDALVADLSDEDGDEGKVTQKSSVFADLLRALGANVDSPYSSESFIDDVRKSVKNKHKHFDALLAKLQAELDKQSNHVKKSKRSTILVGQDMDEPMRADYLQRSALVAKAAKMPKDAESISPEFVQDHDDKKGFGNN